ncbi:putative head proximal tip of tail tube protein [Sinorhizobium phage phiM9]|uniref:Putative head proximal tip of tail tube protein n=1 Tax=Sinorhizobium phage phiM9 TaxID=1636182 RepID=A0A0F6TH70_9CAUD|nr:putative head proximal tip of tail tube protein [Sinorhizobium phage phiM9]AKE44746.1 putative head proximal tip of tail tube protein [Sinorhizobium phage phiM9]
MSTSLDGQLNNINGNVHQLVINRLKDVSFKATRVSLPGFSFTTTGVDFPNIELNIPGLKFRSDPVVITFLVDENMTNYFECLKWLVKCRYYEESDLLTDVLQDFTINLLDNHERTSVSFRYTGGFIQGIDSIDFESSVNEASPVKATVTLRYQNVEIDAYNGKDKETVLSLRV